MGRGRGGGWEVVAGREGEGSLSITCYWRTCVKTENILFVRTCNLLCGNIENVEIVYSIRSGGKTYLLVAWKTMKRHVA